MQKYLILFTLLLGCRQPTAPLEKGAYFWKTNFAVSPGEKAWLEETNCRSLWVKFADIGRMEDSGEVQPFSLLQALDTTGISTFKVIPCFFITNNVFKNTSEKEINWLAERLVETLESVGSQFGKKPQDWPEIQLDCDWTASTRDNYFYFLQALQKQLPKASRNVTIRLHQYKNPRQTGVPPAEKGTLMCYNTGDIDNDAETNSILNPEQAAPYFQVKSDYPLALDLALPMFSWALVYRDEALWRIIPEAGSENWTDSLRFSFSGNTGVVKKATFVAGYYLRPNDQIRLETATPDLLYSTAGLIGSVAPSPGQRLLLYHLDSLALQRFPAAAIEKIADSIQYFRTKK